MPIRSRFGTRLIAPADAIVGCIYLLLEQVPPACKWLVFATLACLTLCAQDKSTRIYGPQDQDVPTPQFHAATGQKDAAAMEELQTFLSAVGVNSWSGIQATGTFGASGSQDSAIPAMLTISGAKTRLDLTTTSGTRSIRINGPYGETIEPDGSRHSMPFLAATAGLMAFPMLFASEFTVSNMTVIDGGIVAISGENLHRVTIERPLFSTQKTLNSGNTSVLDLYFDTTTDLLIKSAAIVRNSWSDRNPYLAVTTYGKYQSGNEGTLPFSISRTVNGQPDWSLTLSSVQPLPALNSSYFQF